MKSIEVEISNWSITESKQEFDKRIGERLQQMRQEEHANESLEQIAEKVGISGDAILRCESGQDIPHYEYIKLLDYYEPDYCSCTITRIDD